MRIRQQPPSRPRWGIAGVMVTTLALIGSLMTPSASMADETTDVARWDFTTGTASDVSWHGHDGTATDAVTFQAEGVGAVFNGSNASEITVQHAAALQPTAAGTDGTWRIAVSGIVPSTVGSIHRTVMGSRNADNGWALYITPTRKFEFWMAQTTGATKYAIASSNVVAEAGKSYDIVVERTGAKISIAVTGAATGSGTGTLGGTYNPVADGTPLRFGNGGNTGGEFFYAGSIAGATLTVAESESEPPVEPEPPVTIPDPDYPLTDEQYEAAAAAVFARTAGDVADQVSFDMVRSETHDEKFTIDGTPGNISIAASTPSALTAGAGWYLKYVANAAVNLGAAAPTLPDVLPAPDAPITKTGHEAYRFALNDTNEGYTDPYLDWEGWERLLDNLALHGINQVFLSVGTDSVFAQLLTEYGYTDAEARAWIPQPAHQPWWVLQNISNEGQEPMTSELLTTRAELASKIVDRADELGILPVLPGYFGTVPTDFAERNPGANVVPQGTWSNYQRPGWLDPTTPLFAEVAADFYRISSELIGAGGVYKMDPLHEGGRPGDVSVPDAAAGIEAALRAAHPTALWSLLGWQSNPTTTLLSGVKDKSRLLIVDGLSDTVTTLDRESRWPGIPWAFGSIYNFGGNTSIGAISTVWLDRYFAARAKSGSSMNGVAILPEGFYNNPAAYELMSELPWMDSAPDHAQWFRDYAKGRYGTDAAAEAWETIAETAYSMEPIGTHSESHDGLFSAQPSLTTTKARACCARGVVRYDMAAFAAALPQLLEADASVVQRDAYEYDVTDLTRQVVVNVARDLLPQIKAAHDARDVAKFDELTATWMDLIQQLDEVLATEDDFLLGAYVERAKAQNGAIGTYDLQNLLAAWGTEGSFGLHDYANREWQGLMGDFYASRWKLYFSNLRTALTTGTAAPSVDWFAFDEKWAKADHGYPSTESGDVITEAEEVVDFLGEGATSITLDAPAVRPGTSAAITATVQNTSPLGVVDSAELTLKVPEGLTVENPTVRLEDLSPGEKRTMTWAASIAPEGFSGAIAKVSVDARVAVDDEVTESTSQASILVGAASSPEWKLHSTEPGAEFAFADAQIGLRTTGRDFSRTSRYFSSAYREDVVADGDVVTVHVDLQETEGSRPWARTGLILSSGVATANSPMAVLALTPSNGCALTWNSGTGGSLDTHRNNSAFSGSAWLRMVRTGSSFVGSCSDDGKSWTTIGTAVPAGIGADAVDAGIFSSAVNTGASDRVLAGFSKWSVREVTAPTASAAVEGRTVTLTAEADSSDIARIEYAIGDGAWQTYTAPITLEGHDAVVVSYRAVDTRGVTGPTASVTVPATDPADIRVITPRGNAKTVLIGERTAGFGAQVHDGYGHVVRGAEVTFTVTGGEFLGGRTTVVARTNGAGIVMAPAVSSQSAGEVTITAAVGGEIVTLPTLTVVESTDG